MRAGQVSVWLAILALRAAGPAWSASENFFGPTARLIPARGNAPGDEIPLSLSAESPSHRHGLDRAFSPSDFFGIIPGALPRAGMERAFGPDKFLAPANKKEPKPAPAPKPGPGAAPAPDKETPADLTAPELLKEGRAAFDARDFAKAEKNFDQLLAEYGENAEVAPLVDECRPMLAMCKVKAKAFDDAVELIDASLKNAKLPAAAREELQFWRGICLLQTNEVMKAQEQFGEYYADEKHDRTRRFESFLLFGTGYIQLEDYDSAADFFSDQIPKLPQDQAEVAGRATVLLLHSLIEAGRDDEALQLVRRTFPKLQSLTQIVSFQLLTLSLGAQFLADEKHYAAIACLNRLWPRERLLKHQHAQLDRWKQRRDLLKKEGAKREALVFQTDGIITRVERELEQFAKIESYDAALKLRLAQAFMGLERWREAGMILDEAVATIEPDKTVEQAAITAIDCWQQTGDNARVIAAADRYLNIYGDHRRGDHVPDAIFAKGEGLRGEGRQQEAEKEFGDIANEWPIHPIAPRAMLMGGICQMERGESDSALITFHALRKRFKKGPLHEDAMFWEGMAMSLERRYDEARTRLAASLEAYPNGRYAAAAEFERARCLHNQTKHAEAVKDFQAWLKKYPRDRQENEATLLLAESLMADGEMEQGMKMLTKIPADDPKLWEEAQFKKGEALRKLGNMEKVRVHYEEFIKTQPRSRRLAEAALWQSRAVQKLGQPEAARALVWSTLEKLGNDPANEGVEDLLGGLPKLYRGPDEMRHLTVEMEQKASDARKTNRKTLALRLTWAHARAIEKSSPGEAKNLCFSLADLIDPVVHHPRIIADCADAWRDVKGHARAKQFYTALRRWHPRAVEKERSSFGLGMIALAANDEAEAAQWFDRCIAESIAGASGNDAQLEKAALLRKAKKPAEAVAALERVTTSRLATSAQKSRALLALGHCAMDTGDLKRAASHFERCYLSGAKYKDTAAEARLQHGLIFEKLKDRAGALTAYRDLLERKDLAFLPPAQQARARITALEGGER